MRTRFQSGYCGRQRICGIGPGEAWGFSVAGGRKLSLACGARTRSTPPSRSPFSGHPAHARSIAIEVEALPDSPKRQRPLPVRAETARQSGGKASRLRPSVARIGRGPTPAGPGEGDALIRCKSVRLKFRMKREAARLRWPSMPSALLAGIGGHGAGGRRNDFADGLHCRRNRTGIRWLPTDGVRQRLARLVVAHPSPRPVP
jgi:hypothetical protein